MKKTILASLLITSALFSANHEVNQSEKTFKPHAIEVNVGDTITFKNSDPFAHNAYTDDEANEFDIGMQGPGKPASIQVKKAGTFSVECAIHPNMLLEVNAK